MVLRLEVALFESLSESEQRVVAALAVVHEPIGEKALLDWLKLLMAEDIGPETLRERDPKKLIPPLHGALIKNEQDVHLFERLAFMARREGR